MPLTKDQVDDAIEALLETARKRDPDQPEFLQALEEIVTSLRPALPSLGAPYVKALERMIEPESVVQFRVPWVDDQGTEQVNRGWRVLLSTAVGPGKGGLRFRNNVTLGTLKFLALEQALKNALTTLPMGAAKGGSDFDPAGKSDREVQAFCQSFMTALYRHIGPDVDVPAGDIGVGGREIGYLFGQYKRITGHFNGTLTGKGPTFGGSLMRPEATGYGAVFFLSHVLNSADKSLDGLRVYVSGSGNVAQNAAVKLTELGAHVASLSDSAGTVFFGDKGADMDTLEAVKELKNVQRGRLSDLSLPDGAEYVADAQPWSRVGKGDVVFPCATQNEIDDETGKKLADVGILALAEGANMPTSNGALQAFLDAGVLVAPAKATNAGGVAVSGLEMSQNAQHLSWTAARVTEELERIMADIFQACQSAAEKAGVPGNLVAGANIAGFVKVAEAMIAHGTV